MRLEDVAQPPYRARIVHKENTSGNAMNVPALRKPLLLTSLLAALLLPVAAQAQSWPSRPVKIVVPFAPGGTADLFGRIAAEHLSKEFSQQFVIENRGGAGGLVGSAGVVTADPDGHTLLIS